MSRATNKKPCLPADGFNNSFVANLPKMAQGVSQWEWTQKLDPGVGLGLLYSSGGSKTWRAITYVDGKPIKVKIGSFDDFDVTAAKKEARKHADNPEAKKAEKAVGTFGEVSRAWFEDRIKDKALRAREVERCLAKYVNFAFDGVTPRWNDIAFVKVDRQDIIALLDVVERDHGAAMATAVLTTVKAIVNWRADRIPASVGYVRPAMTGLKRGTGKKRRALDTGSVSGNNEVKRIWDACDNPKVNANFGAMVRVMLLTGQRRERYLTMRWEDISPTGVWIERQGEREKNFAEMIPLPRLALDIINAQPRTSSYVFTCRAVSKFKRQLDKVSGVTDWQLHSLRHTCRTLMANPSLQIDSAVAESVLGHALPGQIQALYVHHDFSADNGKALAKLADHVEQLTSDPTPAANVVPMPRQAA
jgi:integrase